MRERSAKRDAALALIRRNIAEHGHHIYLIGQESTPRFAYTIGLTGSLGAELVLAGGSFYDADDVKELVNALASRLRGGGSFESVVELESLGAFRLRRACSEWVASLLLGALDYYGEREIVAYQIVPDEEHWTIDVPNMEEPWSATSHPTWKWLREEWPHAAPEDAVAVTNLDALRGGRITEAARWETDQWEVFAGPGPDVKREDVRVVPLAVLLGADASLGRVVDLEIGEALWRDEAEGDWQRWERAASESAEPEGE